jgi:hypothetical protein
LDGSIWKLPLPPIGSICFPGNTPIKTDQGIIEISKVEPEKHTINGRDIEDVIRTVSVSKWLVCIKEGALGYEKPSKETCLSREHKVYYKGKMREAYKLIGKVKGVYKKRYDGSILYNVLMKEHSKMLVNDMVCETLDPSNMIALLYSRKSKYSEKERECIISELKRGIKHDTIHKHS